ncbi:MAG TPA: hypothetical protein VD993_16720 [Chitinophagaceae bacterium]|nr:hypothetical protein [Chitinophagaceae bacterium]
MQQYFFSDSDIEDYLDGVFEGDAEAIKIYLYNTAEGKQRLNNIQALYAALREEEQPRLFVPLSESVLSTLAARKAKKKSTWGYLVWLAGAIAAGALIFYCWFLLKNVSVNYIPFIIVMALVITAFQWIDVYRMKERYAQTVL